MTSSFDTIKLLLTNTHPDKFRKFSLNNISISNGNKNSVKKYQIKLFKRNTTVLTWIYDIKNETSKTLLFDYEEFENDEDVSISFIVDISDSENLFSSTRNTLKNNYCINKILLITNTRKYHLLTYNSNKNTTHIIDISYRFNKLDKCNFDIKRNKILIQGSFKSEFIILGTLDNINAVTYYNSRKQVYDCDKNGLLPLYKLFGDTFKFCYICFECIFDI